VELHEFKRPDLVATLISRFRDSHEIRIIEEADRNPSRYRILRKLPRSWQSVAVQETKWISSTSRTTTWLRFMVLDPKERLYRSLSTTADALASEAGKHPLWSPSPS
jgi:hypothetical protein